LVIFDTHHYTTELDPFFMLPARPTKILLCDGVTGRSPGEYEALLTQLRCAGIPVTGGARLSEDDHVILIDKDSDADCAIAILAKLGVNARRG
jgi:hypothetical protein